MLQNVAAPFDDMKLSKSSGENIQHVIRAIDFCLSSPEFVNNLTQMSKLCIYFLYPSEELSDYLLYECRIILDIKKVKENLV